MKNTAAEFIRRTAFVDANALLKDECGVEYKKPSQVQYYALFKDHDDTKAINEALKHVADMLGCMWDIDCDGPGIIGLFETKEEADAHAKYAMHRYGRAMIVVEYQVKEDENK